MKREFFLRAIDGIDDEFLIEAFAENQQNKTIAKNRKIYWRWGISVAACLLVGVSVWAAVPSVFMKASDNMAPEAAILPGDVHEEVLFDAAIGIVPTDDADGDLKTEAAENGAVLTETVTENTAAGVPSTYLVSVTAVRFSVYENGEWRSVMKSYPNGLPGGKEVVDDYLAEAGADVRAVSFSVQYTETGCYRVATVVLEADPGEDTLRGLILAVGDITAATYVRVTLADGTILPIDGEAPEEGFDLRRGG